MSNCLGAPHPVLLIWEALVDPWHGIGGTSVPKYVLLHGAPKLGTNPVALGYV